MLSTAQKLRCAGFRSSERSALAGLWDSKFRYLALLFYFEHLHVFRQGMAKKLMNSWILVRNPLWHCRPHAVMVLWCLCMPNLSASIAGVMGLNGGVQLSGGSISNIRGA
jgi:hypothetical protein